MCHFYQSQRRRLEAQELTLNAGCRGERKLDGNCK